MSPDALRAATIGGVVLLAGVIGYARFFGAVGLPDKPPPPAVGAPVSETLGNVAATADAWIGFVARDAASAGVPAPSAADMAKKLVHRSDEEARVIAPGEGSIEVAGLRLTASAEEDDGPRRLLALTIENLTSHDVAYRVVTEPRPGGAACNMRSIRSYDAIVVRRGAKVVRSECSYRQGMSLGISRVETVELLPLMSLYVSQLPPAALGTEARLSRGHRPELPAGWRVCTTMASRSAQSDIEEGRVAWRDLVDYYARHRCETYSFPEGYRAFEKNGQRPLPAVE